MFETHENMMKHIQQKYINNYQEENDITCDVCKLFFDNIRHFQCHALEVHNIVTDQSML